MIHFFPMKALIDWRCVPQTSDRVLHINFDRKQGNERDKWRILWFSACSTRAREFPLEQSVSIVSQVQRALVRVLCQNKQCKYSFAKCVQRKKQTRGRHDGVVWYTFNAANAMREWSETWAKWETCLVPAATEFISCDFVCDSIARRDSHTTRRA